MKLGRNVYNISVHKSILLLLQKYFGCYENISFHRLIMVKIKSGSLQQLLTLFSVRLNVCFMFHISVPIFHYSCHITEAEGEVGIP